MMNRRSFLVRSGGAAAGLALGVGRPINAHAAKTLRMFTPEADPGQVKVWSAIFEDYTAKRNKDVAIKGEYAKWDDITKKLAADIAAGKPPEFVAGTSKPDFVAAEVKRGLVVDHTSLVDQLGRSNFNAAALKAWQYRGIQMAIPYGMQWPVLWYRKDLFAEKGLKAPTTWDDYRAAAEKLNDPAKGMYAAVFPAGRTWYTHLISMAHIWSAGGYLFDDKLNVVFDSPETRRALQYYADMAMKFSPPDVGQYAFREGTAAFVSGKTATTFYWGRVLSHLYGQAPQLVAKSSTVHIPRDKQHRTVLTFDEFYIHKTPNVAETTDVVKYMLEPEQVMRIHVPVMTNITPTMKTVEPLFAQHEWLKANPELVKAIVTPNDFAIPAAQESPRHPFNYKYEVVESKNILTDCVQKIVVGKEPVAKAVEWAHKQMVEATKDIKD